MAIETVPRYIKGPFHFNQSFMWFKKLFGIHKKQVGKSSSSNPTLYYTTSRSKEDDLHTAIDCILAISPRGQVAKKEKSRNWEDAHYYLVYHAQFNDVAYKKLMLGLMERIETNNCHLGSDEAVLLNELLYTNGNGLVSKTVFATVKERLKASVHPTCVAIASQTFEF